MIGAAALAALLVAPPSALASQTQTVITIADTGAGSLRDALNFANANPGTTIEFAIPGSGVHTIEPATPLPAVQEPTTIDGASQPGYASSPLIRVDGGAPGDGGATGLILSSSDTVTALEVTGWSTGIAMPSSNGSDVIRSSYIGTDGTAALPNATGISITGPTTAGDTNTIGGPVASDGNVISGNSQDGIVLSGSQVQGSVIAGNAIGTTGDRFDPLPNNGAGVHIESGAHDNLVGGQNGLQSAGGNEIGNNGSHGVIVDGAATVGNAIEGNDIHDNAPPDIALTGGGNRGEAAPTITSVDPSTGTVSGTVAPGAHRIELFESDACGLTGVSGFVGAVMTSSTHWSLSDQSIGPNDGLLATSTSTATSDTSEYSRCAVVPPYPCGGVVATTLPATNVTTSSATLNGMVDGPCGAYGFFEHGTTTGYGANAKTVRSTTPEQSVASEQLSGLAPNTTYHFRVVGTDILACRPQSGGGDCNTSYGADMTFTTMGLPPIFTIDYGRAKVTRKFRARLLVGCPQGVAGSCAGRIRLTRGGRLLGSAVCSLPAGADTTLRVKLDRRGRRSMSRHRRLRVQVTGPVSAAGDTVVLTRSFRVRR